MNGVGLMGAILLSIALYLIPLGLSYREFQSMMLFVGVVFSVVGSVALVDDLLLNEKLTRRILSI